MSPEPEPNGWELMRGLNALKTSVDGMAAGMVSQAIFSTALERIAAIESELADQRKTKAQQWFAIGMSILGLFLTVIGGVILFNLKGGVA